MNLRIVVIIAAAAVLAVLGGGWFVGVQPMLAAAATADEAAQSTEAQNQSLQLKLAMLSREAAKTGQKQEQEAVLEKAVPSILKDNTFNRRVNEVAALNGVKVLSFTLGPGTSYTPPVASTAPAVSTDAATPAASASASTPPAAAPAASAPAIAKTDPLITSANFVYVPTTVVVQGTQASVLDFSTAIQNDERVFLINSVVTAKNDDGSVTATLGGYIYTLVR